MTWWPIPWPAGKKNNAVLLRKCLDLLILLEVGVALVLNVVIECEHHLARVLHPGGTHGHELLRDGPGVVVRHASVGLDLHVVAAPNDLSLRETDSMALHDLFRQRLRRLLLLGWGVCRGESHPGVMWRCSSVRGRRPYQTAAWVLGRMVCARDVDSTGVDSRCDCPAGRAIEPTGPPRPGRVSLQTSPKSLGNHSLPCATWRAKGRAQGSRKDGSR